MAHRSGVDSASWWPRCRIFWVVVCVLAVHGPSCTESSTLPPTLRAANGSRDLGELASFQDDETVVVFAHQDDDLLWMLPFWPEAHAFLLSAYPAFAQFKDLIQSFPPGLRYAQRWEPIWGFTGADEFAVTFTDKCSRERIVYLDSIKERLRPYLKEGVRRVVTHNNWGEYGHHQHRLVSQAVRELAVEYRLDVYALGVQVHWQNRDRSDGYENVAGRLDLPQPLEGYFDPQLFQRIRRAYIDRVSYADTPEATRRLRSWSPTLWTWSQAALAFPAGWRPFVKLVQAGHDLTVGNGTVRTLTEQPIVNACPET